MTVRETLNFSARCQGVGSRAEIMMEVNRREKEARILPDPDIDTFMKAIAVKGLKTTLQTDYILKILGLDICADTLVGNAMRRGISGGQKKRLTTGRRDDCTYWRSPSYNLPRIMYALASSLFFGVVYWNQGQKIDNQQNLFNILGSMFIAVLFNGINNSSSVLPYVATERTVMYRERFAGMYSPWAYAFAQVIVEVPYVLIQTAEFVIITYPMIGYYASGYKVFWYFYTMFCSLLYFNFLGMALVSLTPNVMVAAILASFFYKIYNIFSGFVIPQPEIPGWWIWMYYLTPTSWSLRGMLTSQYGDIHEKVLVFGETKTMASFLKDYFGFQHDQLAVTAIILMLFPVAFALLFAFCVGRLNFQRR
ncbi:hypothetical protein SLE2022_212230 [Rubroshorea leprosula]